MRKKRRGEKKGIAEEKRQAMERNDFGDSKRNEKRKGGEKIKQSKNKRIVKEKRQVMEREGFLGLQNE